MPEPGKFVLHSSAVPDLSAGPYTVSVEQSINAPGASVAPLATELEVTGPRFLMSPDQILSTFPPNQSEGAYSSRLPQIVLRRRTLPWERKVDEAHTPWLALVLLADAEAEFKAGVPVAECVTPGVAVSGRTDVAVGDRITVTRRVIEQVFPTRDELPLLTHVREVDLNDTELALGDDDGWLAVVLSNRLPQPGVRYTVYLISLEGQLGALPQRVEAEDEFDSIYVYPEAALQADLLTAHYRATPDRGAGAQRGELVRTKDAPTHAVAGARSRTVSDAWSSSGGGTSWSRYVSPSATATLVGDMHAVGMEVIEPADDQYRFPVLAHWTFTCAGSGDFQSLMQELDVGILGTLPPEPKPPEPGEKPPAPRSRPEPELLDTGHIALDATSRAGEPQRVWYRGPLVSRPVSRTQPDARGLLPLLHASDQARRVGPDGRENLSLATAFEIGRLLALAEPSVVAALLTWRKDAYDDARRGALLENDVLLAVLLENDVGRGFAARVGNELVAGLGEHEAAQLGPVRPHIDPGLPIQAIDAADPIQTIATGFALSPELVAELANPEPQREFGGVELADVDRVTGLDALAERADDQLAGLRAAVTREADRLAAIAAEREARAPSPGEPAGEPVREPDALDGLLDALGRRSADDR